MKCQEIKSRFRDKNLKIYIDKSTIRDYSCIIIPYTGRKRGDIMVIYPVLIGEIAKRGIKKKTIAQSIGVCDKALNNKLNGKSPFTWPEVKTIRHRFFPDMNPEALFSSSEIPNN